MDLISCGKALLWIFDLPPPLVSNHLDDQFIFIRRRGQGCHCIKRKAVDGYQDNQGNNQAADNDKAVELAWLKPAFFPFLAWPEEGVEQQAHNGHEHDSSDDKH